MMQTLSYWPIFLCVGVVIFFIFCFYIKSKEDEKKSNYHGHIEVLEITDNIQPFRYNCEIGESCVKLSFIAINCLGEHVLFTNVYSKKDVKKGDKGKIVFGSHKWFYKGDFDIIE